MIRAKEARETRVQQLEDKVRVCNRICFNPLSRGDFRHVHRAPAPCICHEFVPHMKGGYLDVGYTIAEVTMPCTVSQMLTFHTDRGCGGTKDAHAAPSGPETIVCVNSRCRRDVDHGPVREVNRSERRFPAGQGHRGITGPRLHLRTISTILPVAPGCGVPLLSCAPRGPTQCRTHLTVAGNTCWLA